MKKSIAIAIVACLTLVATVVPVAIVSTGCQLFKVADGARAEVVRAEQFEKLAFTTTDMFLQYVEEHRATLNPEIIGFAVKLSTDFPPADEALITAIRAYKLAPTTDNLAALQKTKAALQVIYDLLSLQAPASVKNAAEKKATQ